jgi:hypothetical protein
VYIIIYFEYWEDGDPIPFVDYWIALPDELDRAYDAIYACYPEACKILREEIDN